MATNTNEPVCHNAHKLKFQVRDWFTIYLLTTSYEMHASSIHRSSLKKTHIGVSVALF